jgi:hypothetical protein
MKLLTIFRVYVKEIDYYIILTLIQYRLWILLYVWLCCRKNKYKNIELYSYLIKGTVHIIPLYISSLILSNIIGLITDSNGKIIIDYDTLFDVFNFSILTIKINEKKYYFCCTDIKLEAGPEYLDCDLEIEK